MDYHSLIEWVTAKPFDPFKLVSTDDAEFLIQHPTLIWPGSRTVMIGFPDDPEHPDIPGKHLTLAIDHIGRIEPLQRV